MSAPTISCGGGGAGGGLAQGAGDAIADEEVVRGDTSGLQGSNVYITDGTSPLIALGGRTSAFAGIKRNGTRVELRVGDDSALTDLTIRAGGVSVAFNGLGATDPAIRTTAGTPLIEFITGSQSAYIPIAASRVTLNGTTVGIFTGAGSPEGAVAAGVGAIYLRTDGGAGTSAYIKESGTGNTGWKTLVGV